MKTAILIRVVYILGLVLVALFGCSKKVNSSLSNTSETKTNTETNVNDSAYKGVHEKQKPAVNTGINAGNPCDSLGNLKPIYIEVKSGENKAAVDTRSGILKTECYCDSTVERLEREFHIRDSAYRATDTHIQHEAKSVETIKNVVPLWCWITIVVLAILSVVSTYGFFKILIIKFR